MTKEQREKIIEVLVEFVVRVATENKSKTPEEVAVLPAIAGILCNLDC